MFHAQIETNVKKGAIKDLNYFLTNHHVIHLVLGMKELNALLLLPCCFQPSPFCLIVPLGTC